METKGGNFIRFSFSGVFNGDCKFLNKDKGVITEVSTKGCDDEEFIKVFLNTNDARFYLSKFRGSKISLVVTQIWQ